jgi:L-alanine-DL-glutamate epimerase-like enolase superfamily enzyme
MSNNKDSIPGRSEALIPLVRSTLGDDIQIHADSNGSYDPPKAIDIGRRLEDINATFYEEPCPFDRLVDTKRVADALTINVAGGECESSQRRFRWMIENGAVQVVQPDLHYYGGFIRATRVARMAARANMTITPHISGGNTGYGEVLQFASYIPNIGPYMEYKGVKRKNARWSGKGDMEDSAKWYGAPLKRENGKITIPDGPGLGLKLDAKFIAKAKSVKG